MEQTVTSTAALTREVIRSKIFALNDRERDLCKEAYETYKSGDTVLSKPISDHDRAVHDRARSLLNGAGGLLPELPNVRGQSKMQAIEEELASIRIALRVLNDADREREAIEIAEWAVEHTPAWRKLMRAQILAMAAFFEANDKVAAFLDVNEGARAQALTYRYPMQFSRNAIRWAVEDGLVKASEVKGALHNA